MHKKYFLLSLVLVASGCSKADEKESPGGHQEKLQYIVNQSLNNMVYVEGDTFIMGDFGLLGDDGVWRPYFPPTAEQDKAHEVTLSSYSLASLPTTWEEYDTYRLDTAQPVVTFLYRNDPEEREPYIKIADAYEYILKPALVPWKEAKNYCLWLSKKTELRFDLPTSAQWEFAARNRGATEWLYPTHDGNPVADYAHPYYEIVNQRSKSPAGTRLPPNPLGIYDTAGNGEEWVSDWYSETYYGENPKVHNPQGPDIGDEKIMRALGTGSLAFSFSRRGTPDVISSPLGAEHDVNALAGFRCAVQSTTPVNKARR
tara:strand:- start:565 stop:1506 length:942 start_codon:yes stop_codon:yes gene_type:complete